MIGGLTYPEVRVIRGLEAEKILSSVAILGGTALIRPKDYMEGIKNMSDVSGEGELGLEVDLGIAGDSDSGMSD